MAHQYKPTDKVNNISDNAIVYIASVILKEGKARDIYWMNVQGEEKTKIKENPPSITFCDSKATKSIFRNFLLVLSIILCIFDFVSLCCLLACLLSFTIDVYEAIYLTFLITLFSRHNFLVISLRRSQNSENKMAVVISIQRSDYRWRKYSKHPCGYLESKRYIISEMRILFC